MARIDTDGTYRGRITEHSLDTTKKGYPQLVARLKATEKFIDNPAHFEHFGIEEPTWVDWSEFGEEIVGFFVLFNDPDEFSEDTALLNYEQLQIATGWDGDEFYSLNNDSLVDKDVLFRVEEDEYDGKTQMKVNWIDAWDANPARELRKLDNEEVKDLSSKLKVKKKSKPAASKPAASKPAGKPASKGKSGDKDKGKTTEEKPSAPPKKGKPEKTEETEQPDEQDDSQNEKSTSLPTELSQGDAWEFVCDHKGGNTDRDVQDAWIAACEEVGPDKDEDDFTNAEWAEVRDLVIQDLSLDV